jgi:phage tail-like protein
MPAGPSAGDPVARFSLTIDGYEIASFSELVAITSEAGSDDLTGKVLSKLPGRRKPPTVTLRRAVTGDMQMSAWHDSAVEGRTGEVRKHAALVMYDNDGHPVARYHLENAWPSQLEVAPLKAGSNEVLYETVTLMCDAAQRIAP